MTVSKQFGAHVFECDSCLENLVTDEEDFHAAWSHAEKEGWSAWRRGGKWVHRCPECDRKPKGAING